MPKVRRAGPDDVDTFATLRARLWNDEHPKELSNRDHWERLRAYYERAFAGPRTRGFVAEAGSVGIVTLIVDEHTPRTRGTEIRGHVTDMYVVEPARRRGVGRAL